MLIEVHPIRAFHLTRMIISYHIYKLVNKITYVCSTHRYSMKKDYKSGIPKLIKIKINEK